jgi:hypothetical protein
MKPTPKEQAESCKVPVNLGLLGSCAPFKNSSDDELCEFAEEVSYESNNDSFILAYSEAGARGFPERLLATFFAVATSDEIEDFITLVSRVRRDQQGATK